MNQPLYESDFKKRRSDSLNLVYLRYAVHCLAWSDTDFLCKECPKYGETFDAFRERFAREQERS